MHIFAAAGWATISSISVRTPAAPARSRRRALVAARSLQRRLDQRLDRGQEAGLLVVEVAVEGAARDAGELDQVGDRGRLVALLGDRRDHRREEPLALVALGLLAGRAPARPQLPLPQLSRIPPRSSHHRGRTISRLPGSALHDHARYIKWYAPDWTTCRKRTFTYSLFGYIKGNTAPDSVTAFLPYPTSLDISVRLCSYFSGSGKRGVGTTANSLPSGAERKQKSQEPRPGKAGPSSRHG